MPAEPAELPAEPTKSLPEPAESPTEPTVDQPALLRCVDLVKAYGARVAVDGIAFEIHPGETFGLLGPNGAGKSTTIGMLAGVLRPDSGQIEIAGQTMSPTNLAAKASIGFVPQEIALYPDLTARENLRLFARLYGLPRARIRERVDEVLDLVGLSDRAGDQVKTYSGGMQRRLNIGIGLLHQPKLLILDEPTVGVDPQSRNAILSSVAELSAGGMSVLYTTHYMEEAERLCDRIGIVDAGRIVALGTRRELTALVGGHDRVRLTASGDLAPAAKALGALDSVSQVSVNGDGIDLLDENARTALPAMLRVAGEAGATIRSVTVEEPDLEAVFLHLTGKSLRD